MYKIIDHPNEFKEGVRILMRVKRNKDSEGEAGGNRSVAKIITSSPEEYDEAVQTLVAGAKAGERIYGTVDARSWGKAIRGFKQRLLDNDYASEDTRHAFYKDVSNRMVSCLQSPQARSTSLFLFDWDGLGDSDSLVKELLSAVGVSGVLHNYQTKNGWHFITKPFEYPKLLSAEWHPLLQKNAMMLIAY